jgi:predicted amidophosphoribosyltransferase
MAQTLAFGYVVHALMRGGMNMVLPPHCGACDALVDVLGQRYAKCWSKAGIIVAHYCACCGTPFEVEAEPGAVCTACFHTLPNYRRARATILYRSVNHDLVLALKMADRNWIALALGVGCRALEPSCKRTQTYLRARRFIVGGFWANGRCKNVIGALRPRKRYAELVRGQTIFLVDDVITTGATVEAC